MWQCSPNRQTFSAWFYYSDQPPGDDFRGQLEVHVEWVGGGLLGLEMGEPARKVARMSGFQVSGSSPEPSPREYIRID